MRAFFFLQNYYVSGIAMDNMEICYNIKKELRD